MRYIIFDVETPNNDNDRMSAIGIDVVEDGRIVDEYYTLVNPEVRFDSFNIKFTGITPEDVIDAPTFPEVWEIFSEMIGDGVLVAHNATFDMAVLAKCLRAYGILWKKQTKYCCTVQMSKASLPELCDHKLNTVADYLECELDHHNAGSDSRVCAEIFIYCVSHGLSPEAYYRDYDVIAGKTIRADGKERKFYPPRKKRYYSQEKKTEV